MNTLAREHTETPWGIMTDGPIGDGKPWRAFREMAEGLTIGSPHNTELICRVSGYLQPAEANAAFIVRACNAHEELVAALERVSAAVSPLSPGKFMISKSAVVEARAALSKVQP